MLDSGVSSAQKVGQFGVMINVGAMAEFIRGKMGKRPGSPP